MEERIGTWVRETTGTPVHEVERVAVGLGDTDLWRVRRSPDSGDLLLRRFEEGDRPTARREMLAMEAARAHGIPVPEVLACDVMDNRPILLTGWCDGGLAVEAIMTSPATAHAIGTQLGETLGGLHLVPAPAGLSPVDAWIARGGPALAPLRTRLERVPNAGRLLHLDYHPRNVLVTPGRVEGVIDWTNALAGPPHMDLARSRAILRVVIMARALPEGMLDALHAYEVGLVEGHGRVAGPDPHPALSAAWGMAMTVKDLTGHLGKPDGWVTPTLLDTLRREQDGLITAAIKEGTLGI